MPKLDLTAAKRIKVASGEVTRLKGVGFEWVKPSGITQAEALAMLYPGAEIGAYYEVHPSNLFTDTAGTAPVTADGQAVARMTDLSGRGNHMIQGTAAARLLYRTNGTLHWLQADGIDDFFPTTFATRNDGSIGLSAVFDPTLGSNMYGFGCRYLMAGDPGIGFWYRGLNDTPSLQVRTNTGNAFLDGPSGSYNLHAVGTAQSGAQRLTNGAELSTSAVSYAPATATGFVLNIGEIGETGGGPALSSGVLRFKGKFYGGFYSSAVVSDADADKLALRLASLAP